MCIAMYCYVWLCVSLCMAMYTLTMHAEQTWGMQTLRHANLRSPIAEPSPSTYRVLISMHNLPIKPSARYRSVPPYACTPLRSLQSTALSDVPYALYRMSTPFTRCPPWTSKTQRAVYVRILRFRCLWKWRLFSNGLALGNWSTVLVLHWASMIEVSSFGVLL